MPWPGLTLAPQPHWDFQLWDVTRSLGLLVCVCSCSTKISVAWEDWGWLLTCGMGCGLEGPSVIPTIVPSVGLLLVLICRFSLLTVGAGRGHWVPVWRTKVNFTANRVSHRLAFSLSHVAGQPHIFHILTPDCLSLCPCVLFRSADLEHGFEHEHTLPLSPHFFSFVINCKFPFDVLRVL